MILRHITLATGHQAVHRIDTFDPMAVEARSALLPDGGPVPALPAFRVEIVDSIFTIWRGKEPLVTCGVGDSGPEGANLWEQLVTIQKRFLSVKANRPRRGKWLAVVLLPSIGNLTKNDIGWLGDFERCLAAAIILKKGKHE